MMLNNELKALCNECILTCLDCLKICNDCKLSYSIDQSQEFQNDDYIIACQKIIAICQKVVAKCHEILDTKSYTEYQNKVLENCVLLCKETIEKCHETANKLLFQQDLPLQSYFKKDFRAECPVIIEISNRCIQACDACIENF